MIYKNMNCINTMIKRCLRSIIDTMLKSWKHLNVPA